MVGPKVDISSFEDVQRVVNKQYELLMGDESTSKHFKNLNFEEHLPRIYNFWSFVLGIEPEVHSYRGSAFEPHSQLNLNNEDFNLWQKFLRISVEEQFQGPMSDQMLQKAEQLGMMFQYKLGLLNAH